MDRVTGAHAHGGGGLQAERVMAGRWPMDRVTLVVYGRLGLAGRPVSGQGHRTKEVTPPP